MWLSRGPLSAVDRSSCPLRAWPVWLFGVLLWEVGDPVLMRCGRSAVTAMSGGPLPCLFLGGFVGGLFWRSGAGLHRLIQVGR